MTCVHFTYSGAYFTPTAYTFPDGLQSVNGSSSTGGCQPESCVMMPIGSTNINGCECLGNIAVNGTLIDGVIPSIDTRQQGWARELFTVNRNGQSSIMIRFQFSYYFILREVKILLLNCPVQGIGITGVKIYSSFIFPTFTSTASTLLITHRSPPSDNCQSLSTVSISVQPLMEFNSYFVEFLFTNESRVHQLNWVYLGEIRFSDEPPTSTTDSEGEIGIIFNTSGSTYII